MSEDARGPFRVLVCGSRGWIDRKTVWERLQRLLSTREAEDITILHGAARGPDTFAAEWAETEGIMVEEYPAEWKRWGRVAGPMRNQRMLDEGKPDLVIAFRSPGRSTGTDDMISRARRAVVPVDVIMVAEEVQT